MGVQIAVVGRVHRGGGEGGGEGRVGHELRRDHTHLAWFCDKLVSVLLVTNSS